MKNFVKLTMTSNSRTNKSVFVNILNIETIYTSQKNEANTLITLIGGESDFITVEENLSEVVRLIREVQQ